MAAVNDRYPLVLDCRPKVKAWADLYQHGHWYFAEPEIIRRWHLDIAKALRPIKMCGVDICWSHKTEEPYASTEEMRSRVRETGLFVVRWREPGSHPLGVSHNLFRVVHDWYGHILPNNPFTMDGELAAFRQHQHEHLFHKTVLPLVWSEVVLENAFRLYHGHWLYISKPVFDPNWGKEPPCEATTQPAQPNNL